MKTEILVVEGGAAILLDHYQARLDDGQWHSVQLSVESRLAVLRVDNITHSASLHTPIRTGGLGLLGTGWSGNIALQTQNMLRISRDANF